MTASRGARTEAAGPSVRSRITGVLVGAAIGDAMGAATELRTPAQIVADFGGTVRDFVPAPDDTFARGCPAGSITDDFSQAYCLAEAIVAHGGIASGGASGGAANNDDASRGAPGGSASGVEGDAAIGRDAILAWWRDERYQRFAGPTTRASVDRLLGLPVEEPFFLYRGGQATNGAAMRIAPVGCVARSVAEAVDTAIRVSLPTHDNHLATGAAALIAAGVRLGFDIDAATAADPARPFAGLAEACADAAPGIAARARELSHPVPGAEIEDRLRIALELAGSADDAASAALSIARAIGCGIAANEAVPAAIAILFAAADPMDAIVAAVNAGDDADTVATMVGALAGAVFGADVFPVELVDTVERVNGLDLGRLAGALEAVRGT